MEECALDAVAVDLPDVEVGLHGADVGRGDVVGGAVGAVGGGGLLVGLLDLWELGKGEGGGGEGRGSVQMCTGSAKVAQKERSMRVTTRPGEVGVPRWSSLGC